MSDAATRHDQLMRQLLDGRERGLFLGPGEEEEDRILEEMEACWWEMTDEEHKEAERRLAEARMIEAPDALGIDADLGDHRLPRRAA